MTGAVGGFADATGQFLPLACTLNATKVTDVFMRLLGLDRSTFESAALAEPPGAGGVVLLPYLDGERTPNRPEATGALAGPALRREAGPGGAGGVRRRRVRLARRARCARARRRGDSAAGSCSSGEAPGPRRTAGWSPISRGVPCTCRSEQELVAAGACVQAAAALHGRSFADVSAAWKLGGSAVIEPDRRVDSAAVRAAYAKVRC